MEDQSRTVRDQGNLGGISMGGKKEIEGIKATDIFLRDHQGTSGWTHW